MKLVRLTIGASCCILWACTPSIAQQYDDLNKKELRQVVLERDSALQENRSRKAKVMTICSIVKDTLQQVSISMAGVNKEVVSLEESLNIALAELDKIKKTLGELEIQLEQKQVEAAPYRAYNASLKESAGYE